MSTLQSTLTLPSPVCTHPPTRSPSAGKLLPTDEIIHAATQRLELWVAAQRDNDGTAASPSSPPSPAPDSGMDVAKSVAKGWLEKQFGSSSSGWGFYSEGTSKSSRSVNLEATKGYVGTPAASGKENNPGAGGKSTEVEQVERQRSPVLARRSDSARLRDILNGGATRTDATAVVHNSTSTLLLNGFDANWTSEYSYAPGTWLAEVPRLERLGLANLERRMGNPNARLDVLNAGCGEVALADHAYDAEAGQTRFRFKPFVEIVSDGHEGIAAPGDYAYEEAPFKFDPFAEDDDDLAEAERLEWPDTIGFLYGDDESLRWPPVPGQHTRGQDAQSQQDADEELIVRYFGAGIIGGDPMPPPSTWSRYTEASPYRRTSMAPISLADVGTGEPGEPTFWDFWFSLPPLSTNLPFLFGFGGESKSDGADADGVQYKRQGQQAKDAGLRQRANGAIETENGRRYYHYHPASESHHVRWTGNPEDWEWDARSDGLSEGEKLMDISASEVAMLGNWMSS
ncbi:hypothetical protein C8R45DRAFT_1218450 [Mycena sanguinolenta]|nr:hypothetical protein C8R45DRAFT_1218450 [Mycena sanguinolenta]